MHDVHPNIARPAVTDRPNTQSKMQTDGRIPKHELENWRTYIQNVGL